MSNIADSNNPPIPLTPATVPSIVDTLDPDLAAAYRSGNPTIIQAVNAGMTTSAMIVNEVIRMGGGTSGLPPAVQAMVSERQKEMAEQAEAENARLKALAAGIVGLGMMSGSNIAKGGEYYGESSGNTASNGRLDGGQFSAMSIEQMQQVDFNTYQKMSEPEKKQFNNEAMNKAKDERKTAEKGINDIINKMQADGRSGKDIQDVILAAQGYKKEDDLSTPDGLKRQKDRIAALSPELQKYAIPMGDYKVAEKLATDAMADIVAARIGTDQHRHGKTSEGLDKTGKAQKHNEQAAQAKGPGHGRKYAAPTHADSEEDARARIEASLQDGYYSTRESNSVVAYDGWEELYNSRHKPAPDDTLTAKSEIKADLAEADASPQRQTISALPLSAAGMLQPEGVVPAEPQAVALAPAPEPEPQRLLRSIPVQGMSA